MERARPRGSESALRKIDEDVRQDLVGIARQLDAGKRTEKFLGGERPRSSSEASSDKV
jgi:hypothetical protein